VEFCRRSLMNGIDRESWKKNLLATDAHGHTQTKTGIPKSIFFVTDEKKY